jgi:deazaflavin-dependent oxidoreductase (nitroreductase family)
MPSSMSMPADMRAFNRALVEEFRDNGGQVVSAEMLRGAPLLLLNTVGAQTGKLRTTPLGYFLDGPGRYVLWASAMAASVHPAWYVNLVAEPEVSVELPDGVGGVQRIDGFATTATGDERERLLAVLTAASPRVAAHQDRTEREIPLVVVDTTEDDEEDEEE